MMPIRRQTSRSGKPGLGELVTEIPAGQEQHEGNPGAKDDQHPDPGRLERGEVGKQRRVQCLGLGHGSGDSSGIPASGGGSSTVGTKAVPNEMLRSATGSAAPISPSQ